MTGGKTGTDQEVREVFSAWLRDHGGIPSPAADGAAGEARVLRYGAGERIFAAGDILTSLFFVHSGLVRYFYLTPDGKEFNKNFVTVGGVVTSLSSFLEGGPSSFFTEALEETVLVALPMARVRTLAEKELFWERLVIAFIARLALQKERREASFLLESASERYQAFLREFPDIAQRLPQYQIASFIGITPVALSRIRARRVS